MDSINGSGIATTGPTYYWVQKLIVRPKFQQKHRGIENVLTVILVDEAGIETEIVTLHGPHGIKPIEIDATNELSTDHVEPDWDAWNAWRAKP
jgi:hypothetical protein